MLAGENRLGLGGEGVKGNGSVRGVDRGSTKVVVQFVDSLQASRTCAFMVHGSMTPSV